MNYKNILLVLTFLIIMIFYYQDIIKVNIVVFFTIIRGILTVNCGWWNISSIYNDASGVDLYYNLINKNDKSKIIPTNIFGKKTFIVTDNGFIKKILDNSPNIFGVGESKYDFFKSFMKYNVGVSEGCPWKKRRLINENVLNSDKNHKYNKIFSNYIDDIFKNNNPKRFCDFSYLGKKLAMKIVFNQDKIYEPLFKMFSEANSLQTVLFGSVNVNNNLKNNYFNYIYRQLNNPNKESLLWLVAKTNNRLLTDEEIIHQVPHWIFPIVGLISVALPRLLVLLNSDQKIFNKVKKGNKKYIRWCILELFRLNNPVNSTFRTLLKDYNFDSKYSLKKGDQLLILNNPVMRDPKYFIKPNCYIPERWSKIDEKSYYALMFNQGPQRCPGKELAIFILQTALIKFINSTTIVDIHPKIDNNDVPQMINPCKILIKN